MASAAIQMVYEEFSKLLQHRTGLHRVNNVVLEYFKVDQDSTWNTVSFNRIAMVAKIERPKMQFTSY